MPYRASNLGDTVDQGASNQRDGISGVWPGYGYRGEGKSSRSWVRQVLQVMPGCQPWKSHPCGLTAAGILLLECHPSMPECMCGEMLVINGACLRRTCVACLGLFSCFLHFFHDIFVRVARNLKTPPAWANRNNGGPACAPVCLDT